MEKKKKNQIFEESRQGDWLRMSNVSFGSSNSKLSYSREDLVGDGKESYDFDDFVIIRRLGEGSFGKVYLTQNHKNKQFYAMKSIRKDKVIQKGSFELLRNEKLILLKARHPFIISMDYVYTEETRIYFIM